VESARVCIIDDSPIIRETIAIVLGADHSVSCFTVDEFLRDPSKANGADLLILADDALPAESGQLLRGRPVLWLQSTAGMPPTTTRGRAGVPRAFSPEDLRTTVRALLAAPAVAQPSLSRGSDLEYPILPADVARVARRAVVTRLPVLICGEPGTGKGRLARAVHAASQQGRFLHLAGSACTRHALEQAAGISPGGLTIFVHDVSHVSPEGQQLLIELLDCGGFASPAGWHGVHLICGTSQTFSDLARAGSLDREVFYRLSVLPLLLPPLRERVEDIPVLVDRIATDLASALQIEPVTFSARAMARLTHYLWFGNLAELETVLTRSVALADDNKIDADDLLFGYARVAAQQRAARVRSAPSSRVPDVGRITSLDLIINELAHEFKNPMVTIKTVAQYMKRSVADQESREEVARLTGEAVDRMDRVLENLLQFTRFRAPERRDITVTTLLAPGLSNLAPQLSERRVTLEYRPPNFQLAFVDAAQVEYALDNLLHVVARDLQDGQTLSIRPLGNTSAHPLGNTSAVAFEFPRTEGSFAATLSDLLDDTGDDGDAFPLGLALAKTLIERNGGRVEMRSSDTAASVIVWLPSREGVTTGNGKTTSPSS
jgi:DNA-binding NtrC family response regulator